MGRYENDAAQRLPQYKINTYRHYRGSIVLFRYCIKNDSKTIVLLLGVGPTACRSTGTWYCVWRTLAVPGTGIHTWYLVWPYCVQVYRPYCTYRTCHRSAKVV